MVPIEPKEIYQDVIGPNLCSILMEKSNCVQKRMSGNPNSCPSSAVIRVMALDEHQSSLSLNVFPL